jgi:hypothetical protein
MTILFTTETRAFLNRRDNSSTSGGDNPEDIFNIWLSIIKDTTDSLNIYFGRLCHHQELYETVILISLILLPAKTVALRNPLEFTSSLLLSSITLKGKVF